MSWIKKAKEAAAKSQPQVLQEFAGELVSMEVPAPIQIHVNASGPITPETQASIEEMVKKVHKHIGGAVESYDPQAPLKLDEASFLANTTTMAVGAITQAPITKDLLPPDVVYKDKLMASPIMLSLGNNPALVHAMEGHFAHLFGCQDKLPPHHPYKNTKPGEPWSWPSIYLPISVMA